MTITITQPDGITGHHSLPDGTQVSDGYHTFDELYEHRITLWIAVCRMMSKIVREAWNPTWRTRVHYDGTSFDGWFVLGVFQDSGSQITYHLPDSKWDECDFAVTRKIAPEFDGHTSADVLERLKTL